MAKIATHTSQSLLMEAQMILAQRSNFPSIQSFAPQGNVVQYVFQTLYLNNTNKDEVFVKISILNQFYQTRILAVKKLSDKIAKANIDSDLRKGKIEVVNTIANLLPPRKHYSFASKYCAMHNPAAYPINDRIVRGFLAKVIAKGNLDGFTGTKTVSDQKLRKDYIYYKSVYDAFMDQYGLNSLSYQDVDAYLWIAGKENLSTLNLFKLI